MRVGIALHHKFYQPIVQPVINELSTRGHYIIENCSPTEDYDVDCILVCDPAGKKTVNPKVLLHHGYPTKGLSHSEQEQTVRNMKKVDLVFEYCDLLTEYWLNKGIKAVTVGYPKLDRYRNDSTSNQIVFLPTHDDLLSSVHLVKNCATEIEAVGFKLLEQLHGNAGGSGDCVDLLNKAKIVISDWSSAGIEALALGIPTILIEQDKNKKYCNWKHITNPDYIGNIFRKAAVIVKNRAELIKAIQTVQKPSGTDGFLAYKGCAAKRCVDVLEGLYAV